VARRGPGAHSDIQYAVSFLCTFSASPGATHYAALLNVLGYLQALDQQTFFSLRDCTLNAQPRRRPQLARRPYWTDGAAVEEAY